ncbi:hypothetical protein [Caudoviricetes sp.]|nr:hypothetical protein [Caudoviricetes sp.]
MLATKLQEAAGNSTQPVFVEDIFSTYLYQGNGSTQTINNGIDLAGKGGLVWLKSRNLDQNNLLYDTARGVLKNIQSNNTGAQNTSPAGNDLTTFGASGFSLGTDYWGSNSNGYNYASWTFRKQPKFFDVVTYTGNGAAGLPTRSIAHNLGSAPGFVLIKCVTTGYAWVAWHRSVSGNGYLNSTAAFADDGFAISVTSTTVSFGAGNGAVNGNGDTFVMYLFAHDAGGFGLTGTDNVISCGSYTGNGSTSGPVTTLGYEPQWILIKNASATTGGWVIVDNMRGLPVGGNSNVLRANTSGAESTSVGGLTVTATGFQQHDTDANFNASGNTYIYIAIRRGPMKVPTDGTSVFSPVYVSAASGTAQTTNFPLDLQWIRYPQDTYSTFVVDRLRGVSTTPANQASPYMVTNADSAETTGPNLTYGWNNTGFSIPSSFNNLLSIFWNFRRAPSFMDSVCYTGNGSSQTVNHNLGVTPELVIFKIRSSTSSWWTTYGFGADYKRMALNLTNSAATISYGSASEMTAAPTSTALYLGNTGRVNGSGQTYEAYLFATCPGVSKVGTVNVTGSLQTVDCGFTSGARFVLIKSATDSSNSAYGWRVYDSARGITSGNDPVLYLSNTDAQSNTQNTLNVVSSGFQITGNDPYLSSGTFVYLAIS